VTPKAGGLFTPPGGRGNNRWLLMVFIKILKLTTKTSVSGEASGYRRGGAARKQFGEESRREVGHKGRNFCFFC